MTELIGREPCLQVEVPKHIRDCVPARFGVEIIKPRPGEEAEYFGDQVSLLVTDQFSNKFIQSAHQPIGDYNGVYVKHLVKAFVDFLAEQKAA